MYFEFKSSYKSVGSKNCRSSQTTIGHRKKFVFKPTKPGRGTKTHFLAYIYGDFKQ